jgi:hypothetical protein
VRNWRAEDLIGLGGSPVDSLDADAWGVVELSDDPAVLRKLWGLVLLLAVRDRAASVHYHPWRPDGGLAYIVANVRYVMVPPPAGLAGPIVAAARSFIASPGPVGRWVAGRRGAVSGSFTLDVYGQQFEWDLVGWAAGPRCGADFFRVAPPAEASPAEPPAAADPTGM